MLTMSLAQSSIQPATSSLRPRQGLDFQNSPKENEGLFHGGMSAQGPASKEQKSLE
jgi:hypothetical protein